MPVYMYTYILPCYESVLHLVRSSTHLARSNIDPCGKQSGIVVVLNWDNIIIVMNHKSEPTLHTARGLRSSPLAALRFYGEGVFPSADVLKEKAKTFVAALGGS